MPQRRNNPNNKFVKKTEPGTATTDDQPWNRSRIEVEPMPEAAPPVPKGRYNDRIKVSPMDDEGRATDRALKGWPEAPKKA